MRFIRNIYQKVISLIYPVEKMASVKASYSSVKKKVISNVKGTEKPKVKSTPKIYPHKKQKTQLKKTTTTNNNRLADYDLLKTRTYRVDFDISHHKLDYTFYPTVLVPKIGTIIKPPQVGRNGNVGAFENMFLSHVKNPLLS